VGALYGPLHGGANEAVLRMLEVGNRAGCGQGVRLGGWDKHVRPQYTCLPASPASAPTPEPVALLYPTALGPAPPHSAGTGRDLQRIGSVENVGPFLEGVKNRKERMFGFGHRCVPLGRVVFTRGTECGAGGVRAAVTSARIASLGLGTGNRHSVGALAARGAAFRKVNVQ